jgi:Arc/MetJ-type ribon-helix-helix transcriptional regulator
MSIQIPADMQPFVAEQLQLGLYRNEQELIDDAVRLLKTDRDEAIAGIRLGLADAEAGRMQSLADTFRDLRRDLGLGDAT